MPDLGRRLVVAAQDDLRGGNNVGTGRDQGFLSPPTEGNAYQSPGIDVVPMSLREACEVAKAAPELHEIFAPAFIDNLIRIAAFEASTCERRVTDVDRRRYLKMV